MSLPKPADPSFLDRIYLFLKSGFGYWAAVACLFGGLLCSWGIGSSELWAVIIGSVLMLPYALAALIFVPVIVAATIVVFFLIAIDNCREFFKRKS